MSNYERVTLAVATEAARKLLVSLRGRKEILGASVAGSIRRRCETVGDIDIVATSFDENKGESRIEKTEVEGIPAQIYVCHPDDYGSYVLFLTGSKEFNILSRVVAKERKLILSQYGLRNEFHCVSDEMLILYHLGLLVFLDPSMRGKEVIDEWLKGRRAMEAVMDAKESVVYGDLNDKDSDGSRFEGKC